jgi:hypothetical protein
LGGNDALIFGRVIGDLPKDEAERYITWKKSGRERKMTALLCFFAKAAPKEDAPRAGPPTAGLNFGFKQEASTKVGIGTMAAKSARVG